MLCCARHLVWNDSEAEKKKIGDKLFLMKIKQEKNLADVGTNNTKNNRTVRRISD